MTSYDARKDPIGDTDRIQTPGQARAIAVERLNSALYGIRVGTPADKVLADALVSCACSLYVATVLPAGSSSSSRADDTVTRNVGALAASVAHLQDDVTAHEAHVAALAGAVDRLVTRLDVLEDRP